MIKIEPIGGDQMRSMAKGVSSTFATTNRNKRSLAIDLKSSAGLAVFRKLAATADVVMQVCSQLTTLGPPICRFGYFGVRWRGTGGAAATRMLSMRWRRFAAAFCRISAREPQKSSESGRRAATHFACCRRAGHYAERLGAVPRFRVRSWAVQSTATGGTHCAEGAARLLACTAGKVALIDFHASPATNERNVTQV